MINRLPIQYAYLIGLKKAQAPIFGFWIQGRQPISVLISYFWKFKLLYFQKHLSLIYFIDLESNPN